MANKPIPDNVPSMMQNDFGTSVLITDPKSDALLRKARIQKYKIPENRMEKWCGGKNGFDDYAEWLWAGLRHKTSGGRESPTQAW